MLTQAISIAVDSRVRETRRVLLTITATRPDGAAWPATDLGYLLVKNPERVQEFEHGFGRSHVFYPEADDQRCTAALLLDIDPIQLIRGKRLDSPDFSLRQYVNDRPYAASSLLAVAIGQVFRTALRGASKDRPELAAAALPLRVTLPVVATSPELAERLFAPLGWAVDARRLPLDPRLAEVWARDGQGTDSRYVSLTLTGTQRVSAALAHLYVLLPALDGGKHYWISPDEVDKLLRVGGDWLAGHPDRALISRRYLARRAGLVRSALARLAEVDDARESDLDNAIETVPLDEPDQPSPPYEPTVAVAVDAATVHAAGTAGAAGTEAASEEPVDAAEPEVQERRRPLATQRRQAVVEVLREIGAHRVLDLGCGGGALIRDLLDEKPITEIVGVDVSASALAYAHRALRLDRMPEARRARLTLRQGALTYRDTALAGYDAAVLMEVIEHLDLPRLPALEAAVFGSARPATVIVTTPNVEYNVRYETLEAGHTRHRDHRFEWSRAEFADWANGVAARRAYTVEFRPVGELDPELGPPTQMAVFSRTEVPA
jgi:SAM-dependent methyltransferase